MKLIIAGGRDYRLAKTDINILDKIHYKFNITEVVSGGCKGVDTDGEDWAHSHKIPLRIFPADWANLGKYAGPKRNKQMAEYADGLAIFPGGKGSLNMYNEAAKLSLTIFDCRKL